MTYLWSRNMCLSATGKHRWIIRSLQAPATESLGPRVYQRLRRRLNTLGSVPFKPWHGHFCTSCNSIPEASYETRQFIRSGRMHDLDVYALFRLCQHMEEPGRSRVKGLISKAVVSQLDCTKEGHPHPWPFRSWALSIPTSSVGCEKPSWSPERDVMVSLGHTSFLLRLLSLATFWSFEWWTSRCCKGISKRWAKVSWWSCVMNMRRHVNPMPPSLIWWGPEPYRCFCRRTEFEKAHTRSYGNFCPIAAKRNGSFLAAGRNCVNHYHSLLTGQK